MQHISNFVRALSKATSHKSFNQLKTKWLKRHW